MKDFLIWEKWRPKKIEEIILPDRITNQFTKGVTQNYIFYGNYGTGKTSLARILIGKYSKKSAFLEINSSLHTSIDTIRNEVEIFCKTIPIIESSDNIKYVFLDECERISKNGQDALKAFIEYYSKNVRFILTTNHFDKITDGIKSRFTSINFDCESTEEEKSIKNKIFKKIFNDVLPIENISLSKEELVSIINKKFPDIRSIFVSIDDYKITGNLNLSTSNVSNKTREDLYKLIYNKDVDYFTTWAFLMNNIGPDKIFQVFEMLGSPFMKWISDNKEYNSERLFMCNKIISDYKPLLEDSTDPLILGMTVIGSIKSILA